MPTARTIAWRRLTSGPVPLPVVIDHYALFDDVVAVARGTHAPTAGWRAICVRAQRTVGKKVVQPLAELDLEDEVIALGHQLALLTWKAPSEVTTLVFGLFDGVDNDGAGVYTGFHVGGAIDFDLEARWLLHAPTWLPEGRHLESPSLDAIARAAVLARGESKKAVAHALRFGAACLLARFASGAVPYRVVVAFDEGDFAVVKDLPPDLVAREKAASQERLAAQRRAAEPPPPPPEDPMARERTAALERLESLQREPPPIEELPPDQRVLV